MVSLLFSSGKRSHRGLGVNVYLGIGPLPIVNRPVGMLLSGALKPQMLINSHIKECIEAHAPTLTTWVIILPQGDPVRKGSQTEHAYIGLGKKGDGG